MKEVRAPSLSPSSVSLPTGEEAPLPPPPVPSRLIHPLQVEQISRRSDHHFSHDAREEFYVGTLPLTVVSHFDQRVTGGSL